MNVTGLAVLDRAPDRPHLRTLSLTEAAALLRMHPEEVRRRAKCGAIPGAKPGRCWIFIGDDLAEYVRLFYASPPQALPGLPRRGMEWHLATGATSGGSPPLLPRRSGSGVLVGSPTQA